MRRGQASRAVRGQDPQDRRGVDEPDRLVDKDAIDVLRLLCTIRTEDVVA
jgi:hypothetical protein